jgi:hypothetical protein
VTIDAEDVERRVLGCGDVVRLTGGPGGVGMAPARGRRVEGVRDLDPGVEVHVVARWGFTAAGLTTQVRSALATVTDPIVVVIDDVTTPYDRVPGPEPFTTGVEPSDQQASRPPEPVRPEPEPEPVVLSPVEPAPDAVVPVAVVPVAVTTGENTVVVTVEVDVAAVMESSE